jgi:peroxiredoxin
VTSSLKAKGVAFYAVNLEEEPEQINAFLAEKKLKVPVALDKDGSVAGKYLVEGIPQTVIIDKQGSVRVVHIGASPNLKQELTDELEALLAGKKPGKADDK